MKKESVILLLLMTLLSACENKATPVDETSIQEAPKEHFEQGNIDTHGQD